MLEAVLLVFACISPAVFQKLTLPPWISVVLLCYALGLAMSALLGPPSLLHGVVHSLIQVCVVIAIPAMLLAGSWSHLKKLGKTGIKAAFSLWIGAAVACFILLWLLQIDASRIGMILAIFTGGLANLQAAGLILGLDEPALVAANLGDVIAGGILFLVLTSVGWPLLQKLFGLSQNGSGQWLPKPTTFESIEFLGFSRPKVSATALLKAFGLALLCVVTAAGISVLLPTQYLELGIIGLASIVALSIGEFLSPNEAQRLLNNSTVRAAGQHLGEYLMLIFCVLIGWSANWTAVGQEALVWAGQMGLFLAIQLIVSLVLAKALRIEPALYLMALIGSIYSPAFVPPIASSTGRYDLVPTGVLIGLIGLASGTLFGVLFARGFA